MQYNGFKARNVLMWLAVQMDIVEVPALWPLLYLAERRHLASHGAWMLGDILVAMRQGPVPLRTFMELRLRMGSPPPRHPGCSLDGWLKAMALPAQGAAVEAHVTEAGRESLRWAVREAKRLGMAGVAQEARGPAWRHADPNGELDPLEVAREGGADAATLDHVLRWRDGHHGRGKDGWG